MMMDNFKNLLALIRQLKLRENLPIMHQINILLKAIKMILKQGKYVKGKPLKTSGLM